MLKRQPNRRWAQQLSFVLIGCGITIVVPTIVMMLDDMQLSAVGTYGTVGAPNGGPLPQITTVDNRAGHVPPWLPDPPLSDRSKPSLRESDAVSSPSSRSTRRKGLGLTEDASAASLTDESAWQQRPPPLHVTVPSVGIDTSVVEVTPTMTTVDGQVVFKWSVADWAAGHHSTSANPGEGGNIVLAGHGDVRGEVFRGLHDIEIGDEVFLTSHAGTFTYVVEDIQYRQGAGASIEDQMATGMFMAPMPDERVTLITCWPYQVDTHRLVVIAKPQRPYTLP